MSTNNFTAKLKKELLRSPKKTAVLALISVVAIWFWRQKQPALTLFFFLLAALTKPIALLPIPFFALAIWRDLPDLGARLRLFGWGVVWGVTAVWLAFLPFGSPLDLAVRLLREASSGPGFSPATLVLLLAAEWGQPITPEFIELVANLFSVLFGLLFLWLFWLGWNGRSPLLAAADVLAAYSLQALSFRLWYSTWPFLWLLLENENAEAQTTTRLRAGLWFLVTVQLSVLIYGHLRVYVLGGSQLAAHLIGIPFVFFLPYLLASRAKWETR